MCSKASPSIAEWKELDRTTEGPVCWVQAVPMHQYVLFRARHGPKIAVWQLCREKQAFWNSHDGLNLTCLDQCHGAIVLVPMAQAPPKADAKRIVDKVYSLNLIDEFTSLFSPKVIVAGLPRESLSTEACLCRHQCFSVVAQATQDSPKASPRKNSLEQVKAIAINEMLIERWMPTGASMLLVQCANMWPRLQFVSCAEKDSLCGTHDGLNLTCLDQCHGVRSPKKHLCGHRHWSRRLPPEQRSCLYPPDRAPPFVWTTFFLGGSMVSWSAQADHCGIDNLWKVCAHPSCTLLPGKR